MSIDPSFKLNKDYYNAHRIVEKNLGIHRRVCHCFEEELLESIDRLLNDKS